MPTRHVSAVLPHSQPASVSELPPRSQTSTTSSELSVEERQRVNAFFALIKTLYTRRFDSEFSDEATLRRSKRAWMGQILALTPEQERTGFDLLRRRLVSAGRDDEFYWPDVGKIIGLCLRGDLEGMGLPDPSAAYCEACANAHRVLRASWSHPAVYEAGRRTGWFLLRNEQERVSRPAFSAAFKAVCAEVMAGAVFSVARETEDEAATRLEYQPCGEKTRTEQNKRAASAALSQLRGLFS